MPRGGRLTLRAGWAVGGDPLPSARRRPANRVRVEVEDTGTGIEPSETDRIFNPFYTTRDSGTGLGLALAHKIVQDHGGRISFTSTPRRGTTFTIVLPLIPEPPAATPVDLNQLVGNVTRVLQPLLGDNIELLTRLDSGLRRVSANPHQIGQVIMNLVVNARDAMPQGGRLTIETANVGQVVMLAVSDSGSGMDNETRARLFEPYFTTKEPRRGSGVGLATVYDAGTQFGRAVRRTGERRT